MFFSDFDSFVDYATAEEIEYTRVDDGEWYLYWRNAQTYVHVGVLVETPDGFQMHYVVGETPDPKAALSKGQLKTKEEIDNLKLQWLSDPCWDIYDTPGFEAYRNRLQRWQEQEVAKQKELKEREQADWARELGLADNLALAQYLQERQDHIDRMLAALESKQADLDQRLAYLELKQRNRESA